MLDTTFDSVESLKGYAVHPKHVAVADSKVRPYTAVRPVGSVGSRVGVSDPDKAIGSYVEAENHYRSINDSITITIRIHFHSVFIG